MTAYVPSFYFSAPADQDDTTTAIEATVPTGQPSASIYSTYLTTGMATPAYQQQQKKPVEQLPADYFLRRPEESQVQTAIPSSTPKEFKESTYIDTTF